MDNDDVIPVTARLPRDDEGWDEPQRLYRYPPALLEHLRKMPRGDRYTVEHVKDRTVEIARALERQGRPPPGSPTYCAHCSSQSPISTMGSMLRPRSRTSTA
jgi:hypothetical protein